MPWMFPLCQVFYVLFAYKFIIVYYKVISVNAHNCLLIFLYVYVLLCVCALIYPRSRRTAFSVKHCPCIHDFRFVFHFSICFVVFCNGTTAETQIYYVTLIDAVENECSRTYTRLNCDSTHNSRILSSSWLVAVVWTRFLNSFYHHHHNNVEQRAFLCSFPHAQANDCVMCTFLCWYRINMAVFTSETNQMSLVPTMSARIEIFIFGNAFSTQPQCHTHACDNAV